MEACSSSKPQQVCFSWVNLMRRSHISCAFKCTVYCSWPGFACIRIINDVVTTVQSEAFHISFLRVVCSLQMLASNIYKTTFIGHVNTSLPPPFPPLPPSLPPSPLSPPSSLLLPWLSNKTREVVLCTVAVPAFASTNIIKDVVMLSNQKPYIFHSLGLCIIYTHLYSTSGHTLLVHWWWMDAYE